MGQLHIWIYFELQRVLMLLWCYHSTFTFISLAVSKDVRREKQAGVHISPLDTPAPRKVIPKPTHWTSSTSTVKPQRTSLKNKGWFFSCIIFSVIVYWQEAVRSLLMAEIWFIWFCFKAQILWVHFTFFFISFDSRPYQSRHLKWLFEWIVY